LEVINIVDDFDLNKCYGFVIGCDDVYLSTADGIVFIQDGISQVAVVFGDDFFSGVADGFFVVH
jgi:hypothetical protein